MEDDAEERTVVLSGFNKGFFFSHAHVPGPKAKKGGRALTKPPAEAKIRCAPVGGKTKALQLIEDHHINATAELRQHLQERGPPTTSEELDESAKAGMLIDEQKMLLVFRARKVMLFMKTGEAAQILYRHLSTDPPSVNGKELKVELVHFTFRPQLANQKGASDKVILREVRHCIDNLVRELVTKEADENHLKRVEERQRHKVANEMLKT
jgi:hypothetical protein